MVKLILAFSLALFTLNTQAQPHFSDTSRNLGDTIRGAVLTFDNDVLTDTVKYNDIYPSSRDHPYPKSRYVFYFTNTGTEPLIISSDFNTGDEYLVEVEGYTQVVAPKKKGAITIFPTHARYHKSMTFIIKSNSIQPSFVYYKRTLISESSK